LFEQHGKNHRETQSFVRNRHSKLKQDQRIYAIILADLNEEDKNIKEIIERYLREKIPEIRGIYFNRSRDMLQLFLLQLFSKRDRERQGFKKMCFM
jgi:hypothetical protein